MYVSSEVSSIFFPVKRVFFFAQHGNTGDFELYK